jgi:hypothetical protein
MDYVDNVNIKTSLFLALFLSVGYAQNQTEETGEIRSAKIQFLSLQEDELTDVWIRSGNEWISPQMPSTYLAKSFSYSGPASLVFYRKQEQEDGQTGYLPVGSTVLPANLDQLLIMLTPTPEGGLAARTVDTGTDRFPLGSYKIFNLCDRMVGLGMANQLFKLPPEDMQVVKPSVNGREPISVQFMKAGDVDKASLVTTTWFHNPTQRQLVFLIPREEKIEVRAFTLYPEPEPKPEPTAE